MDYLDMEDPTFLGYSAQRKKAEEAIQRMLQAEKHPEEIKEILASLSDSTSKRACIFRNIVGMNAALPVFADSEGTIDVLAMITDDMAKRLQNHTLRHAKKNGRTNGIYASGRDPDGNILRDDAPLSLMIIGLDIPFVTIPPQIHHTFGPYENRPMAMGVEAIIGLGPGQHGVVPPLLKDRYEYLVYFKHENMLTNMQLANLMVNVQSIMDDMARDPSFRGCTTISLPELNLIDQRLDGTSQWKDFITERTFKV